MGYHGILGLLVTYIADGRVTIHGELLYKGSIER